MPRRDNKSIGLNREALAAALAAARAVEEEESRNAREHNAIDDLKGDAGTHAARRGAAAAAVFSETVSREVNAQLRAVAPLSPQRGVLRRPARTEEPAVGLAASSVVLVVAERGLGAPPSSLASRLARRRLARLTRAALGGEGGLTCDAVMQLNSRDRASSVAGKVVGTVAEQLGLELPPMESHTLARGAETSVAHGLCAFAGGASVRRCVWVIVGASESDDTDGAATVRLLRALLSLDAFASERFTKLCCDRFVGGEWLLEVGVQRFEVAASQLRWTRVRPVRLFANALSGCEAADLLPPPPSGAFHHAVVEDRDSDDDLLEGGVEGEGGAAGGPGDPFAAYLGDPRDNLPDQAFLEGELAELDPTSSGAAVSPRSGVSGAQASPTSGSSATATIDDPTAIPPLFPFAPTTMHILTLHLTQQGEADALRETGLLESSEARLGRIVRTLLLPADRDPRLAPGASKLAVGMSVAPAATDAPSLLRRARAALVNDSRSGRDTCAFVRSIVQQSVSFHAQPMPLEQPVAAREALLDLPLGTEALFFSPRPLVMLGDWFLQQQSMSSSTAAPGASDSTAGGPQSVILADEHVVELLCCVPASGVWATTWREGSCTLNPASIFRKLRAERRARRRAQAAIEARLVSALPSSPRARGGPAAAAAAAAATAIGSPRAAAAKGTAPLKGKNVVPSLRDIKRRPSVRDATDDAASAATAAIAIKHLRLPTSEVVRVLAAPLETQSEGLSLRDMAKALAQES